eukprot:4717349-Alexandrium_andersonii.AAC.1
MAVDGWGGPAGCGDWPDPPAEADPSAGPAGDCTTGSAGDFMHELAFPWADEEPSAGWVAAAGTARSA